MANFTSAPIGSTGQSLDGLNVSTSGGPALFLEAVSIGDPTDGSALAPVSSTLGLTVNVASTVAAAVNVTTTVTVSASTQIISSIPFYVSQSTNPWIVSTAPIALVGTSQVFGTVSTQVVSSIPFYVSQSTTPWVVSSAPIALVGTSQVFGTVSTQIVSSIPFFVAQSSSPWTVIGAVNVSSQTGVSSSWPLNTTMANVVSSLPIFVTQSSAPWSIIGAVNISSATAQISTVPSGQTSTFISGQGITVSTAVIPVTQGGLSAFLKIGVTTLGVNIKASAGKLHDIWFTNTATSTRWLKFYNASSAAIGTTAPLLTFGCPGTTTGANAIAGWLASGMGIQFSTQIWVGCTASSATSTDTSTPAATDIVLNCGYI